MKFFFDTEFFAADGLPVSILPISIGIVAEDGRRYYAEFEGGREAASRTAWLQENVLPHLKSGTGGRIGDPPESRAYLESNGACWEEPQLPFQEKSSAQIAEEIKDFIGDEKPEFLASYGAYDWVLLCQCFAGLVNIPTNWPWFYTETVPLGLPQVKRVGSKHNALNDAATLRKAYLVAQPPPLVVNEPKGRMRKILSHVLHAR